MTKLSGGWIYRDEFNTRYHEYRARTGATNKEVAERLGVAEGTLNGYRRTIMPWKPSEKVCVAAAKLFGCSVYEFMPDYGGLVSEDLTPVDQYRVREIKKLLTDPGLSDAEKDMILAAARERWALIQQIKASQ